MINEVSFSQPLIEEEDIQAVEEALRSGWISRGPKVSEFEEKFKNIVGAEDALALNSCTAGLHLALKVLNLKEGDEVITTTMTFAATANVIEHVGARPIFVDVEQDSLLLDPKKLQLAITKKTKAIIVVHFAGAAADMTTINDIAYKNNIHVIEDAAHAFPTKYNDNYIGSSNNLVAFSFYANKNITTGEGGMLVGPKELIKKARILSLHGLDTDAWARFTQKGKKDYDVIVPGYKYNMTDVQAALGISQLNKVFEMQSKRKSFYKRYIEKFNNSIFFDYLNFQSIEDSSVHLMIIKLNLNKLSINRDKFIEELKNYNISTSIHYKPLHMHNYYKDKYNFNSNDYPVAYNLYERIISLPISPKLSFEEIDYVSSKVLTICEKFKSNL
ncbi:MAG: DegT/DnrJ/EryC1/StrS aminotransferase family protein [Bdellovibrionales bacterium]|nr:DegT/DnrJ/EryC1/StrS aminotransferase family protein [Bdellovibrionales bacterium]